MRKLDKRAAFHDPRDDFADLDRKVAGKGAFHDGSGIIALLVWLLQLLQYIWDLVIGIEEWKSEQPS